ncbi:hypothetical protein PybrP1_004698 [[Pythium] brassicae (nom. inval.)]|nr:hypothetical protein PybrP1_004698 [[Pythium] brassicae (nom. inval.)]
MMLAVQHTPASFSLQRPSLSRKRKLTDAISTTASSSSCATAEIDESASPTSLDELKAAVIASSSSISSSNADESSVISPKKKVKASEGGKWVASSSCSLAAKQQAHQEQEHAHQPEYEVETPVSTFEPFAFDGAPADALNDAELEILDHFLS